MEVRKKSKLNKIKETKNVFTKMGIIFAEHPNGQFQIDKMNFWATTQKWYNTSTSEKGIGINSFITMLKNKKIIQ